MPLAHHDGSSRYVSEIAPRVGSTVRLLLRTPLDVERVWVRTTPDAEPKFHEALTDGAPRHGERWWRVDVPMTNPVVRYRFLLAGPGLTRWLNAAGVWDHDVTDGADFWLTSFTAPPAWLDDAVVYQIFPDRFAPSSAAHGELPAWAVASGWDDPLDPRWQVSTKQIYGGDLGGITAHLDHIIGLGANTLYLTPFFPAASAHRYNAETFDTVDPLLGGTEALVALTSAAHRAGLRIIGDLTTNHTGDAHAWFRAAQADRSSEEASYYFFDGDGPDDYVGWFGVRTLPKLDHRAASLNRRMLVGAGSVTGRWLEPPVSLDGWRIDVANMTGRLGAVDTNHLVATTMRDTFDEVRPDGWLVAEHCYDASADLRGDGWHGTMNYAGFTRPAWSWLQQPDVDHQLMGLPVPVPRSGGSQMVATMSAFVAAMPWRSTTASMTLLCSHDTARWRSVAGDRSRQLAGFGMQVAYPGVPMVYYGDEIGLTGANSDLGRVPMPWSAAGWDGATLDGYRRAIAARQGSPALRVGGLRWLYADEDCVLFVRETADEEVLVQVSRSSHPPIDAGGVVGALRGATTLLGRDLQSTGAGPVVAADEPTTNIWRIER